MAEAAALSRTEVRGGSGSGSGSEARGEGRGARGGRMFVLGFLCGATAMLEGRSRGGFLGPGGVAGEAGPGAGHLRPRPPAPRRAMCDVSGRMPTCNRMFTRAACGSTPLPHHVGEHGRAMFAGHTEGLTMNSMTHCSVCLLGYRLRSATSLQR